MKIQFTEDEYTTTGLWAGREITLPRSLTARAAISNIFKHRETLMVLRDISGGDLREALEYALRKI